MPTPQDLHKQIQSLESSLEKAKQHEEREKKFSTNANKTFERNLKALKKFYPNLASAVNEYVPRDDFCIHVTETEVGNFVSKGQKRPIYSSDPIAQVSEQVEKAIEYPTFTLTNYSYYPKNMRDNRLHIEYMRKLGQELEKIDQDSCPEMKKLPDRFPSAMIFGVGLGYHVPLIMEKTRFDYTFIIEPDFEQFFASLFCTDWADVIAKVDSKGDCLFLLVGCDEANLINDLSKIVDDIGAFSVVRSFCYQHSPMPVINSLITRFFNDFFQFQFGHGFYNDATTGLSHSLTHLKKGAPFYSPKHQVMGKVKETPVFIVGNGPSLDEASEFLKRNQDRAIIFACGTALTSLIRMGITPDFHVLVERPYRNYQAVLDMASSEVYKQINLLAVNTIYPDTTDLYKWSGLALKGNEAGTELINRALILSGEEPILPTSHSNPLVSNTGLSFALHFGFSNVYLFGVDNGKLAGGGHHSKFSVYNDNSDKEFNYKPHRMNDGVLNGNLGGTVETSHLYKVSNHQLELALEKIKVTAFNVGNGAFIKGCTPVTPELLIDLEDVDKKKAVTAVQELFNYIKLDRPENEIVKREHVASVFEHLSAIAKEEFQSVDEAADNLKRQQRYLYAFKNTIDSYIFHIIKGSLLYYHCPMLTSLFKYQSKEDSIAIYKRLNFLWLDYLSEMSEHFEEKGLDKCDWEFY